MIYKGWQIVNTLTGNKRNYIFTLYLNQIKSKI